MRYLIILLFLCSNVLASNINIILKDQNSISFAYTYKVFIQSYKPEMLYEARNYCESLKKNTYIAFKKSQGIFGYPKVYDQGFVKNVDGKSVGVFRFICSENQNYALDIANTETYGYLRDFWNNAGHKNITTELEEFKRYISPQEIALNKKKDEERVLRELKEKEAKQKAKFEKQKKEKAILKQKKIASLEKKFSEACSKKLFIGGYEKGTPEYENCLINKENEEIVRQKELKIKLASMSPVERREFNCENAFKFRRGSDDFNQCVFKLYTTELELEKLELQKQVALANQRAAEAQAKAAASDKARADAIAKAQIAAANAQSAAAQSTNLLNSLSVMQMSLNLLTPQRPVPQQQPRFRTTCSNVGGFLSCF